MSFGFVTYGVTSVKRKLQGVFSTNERPWFWSCDPFLANHRAWFLDLKNLKGLPLQEITQWSLSFMGGICHIWAQRRYIWDLSNMGWVLSLMGELPISDKTRAHFWRYRIEYVYIHYGSVKIELEICHISGQRRCIRDLSNMGGFCQLWGASLYLTKPTHIWQIPCVSLLTPYVTKSKHIFDATVVNMYIFNTVALKMSLGFVKHWVRATTFGIRPIWVGFVTSGELPLIWQNPPIFDKTQSSQVLRGNYNQSSRPMRDLDFDHVTPFRPIKELDFWIQKILRRYHYKKLPYGVCHLWVGFVTYGLREGTFGICQIWVWFCHLWGAPHKWQNPSSFLTLPYWICIYSLQ